jgi:hypothetical protein
MAKLDDKTFFEKFLMELAGSKSPSLLNRTAPRGPWGAGAKACENAPLGA